MKKMGTVKLLAVIFGAIVFMQLLCACGSDTKDVGKEAIKNTLDNRLHLKNPDKDAPVLKSHNGRELIAHIDTENFIKFIAKGTPDPLDSYYGFFGGVNLDEEQYQFDEAKIINLCTKIMKANETIKYDIKRLENKEKVDGYEYNEYIVKLQFPDFAKIHEEAGKILEREINHDKTQSKAVQAYEYNKCLYEFYDKTFSDLDNLPMRSRELKYRVRHVVDKNKVNEKDKDKISEYVLIQNDTSDKLPNLIYIMFGEPGEFYNKYTFADLKSKNYISSFLIDYLKNLPSENAYKMLSDEYQKNTSYSDYLKLHKDVESCTKNVELKILSHHNNVYKCRVGYAASKYRANDKWVDKRRLFNSIEHVFTVDVIDLGDGALRLDKALPFTQEYEISNGAYQP